MSDKHSETNDIRSTVRNLVASTPPYRPAHHLSWVDWLAIVPLAAIVWPVGLGLLLVVVATSPVWLLVAAIVRTARKLRQGSSSDYGREPLRRRLFSSLPSLRDVAGSVIGFFYSWFSELLPVPKYLFLGLRRSYRARRLRRSDNAQKAAIKVALQKGVFQAVTLVADHPHDIDIETARIVSERLSELMRADIPALAITATEAAAQIQTGPAAELMIAALIGDIERSWWRYSPALWISRPAAVGVLLRLAQESKLADSMAQRLTRSLSNENGRWWKVEILAQLEEPSSELVDAFVGLLEEQPYDWPPDEISLNLASGLVRWGHASEKAIELLGSEAGRYSNRARTREALKHGFRNGQIPAEMTREIVEQVLRGGSTGDEDVKSILVAAISKEQPRSDVIRITAEVLLGHGADRFLGSVLEEGIASPLIVDVIVDNMEKELEKGNWGYTDRVISIIEKAKNSLHMLPSATVNRCLEFLKHKDIEIRQRVAGVLSAALQAGMVIPDIIHDLLLAARAGLEEEPDHVVPLLFQTRSSMVRSAIDAYICLMNAGRIPWRLDLPTEFEDAEGTARKMLLSDFAWGLRHALVKGRAPNLVNKFVGLLDEIHKPDYREMLVKLLTEVIQGGSREMARDPTLDLILRDAQYVMDFLGTTALMPTTAVQQGHGTVEAIEALQKLVDDPEAGVRAAAVRGLGIAVANGSVGIDSLRRVIERLDDGALKVRAAAAEGLFAVMQTGKATAEVAQTMREIRLTDDLFLDVSYEFTVPVLATWACIFEAGLGSRDMLNSLVSLFPEVERQYIGAKRAEGVEAPSVPAPVAPESAVGLGSSETSLAQTTVPVPEPVEPIEAPSASDENVPISPPVEVTPPSPEAPIPVPEAPSSSSEIPENLGPGGTLQEAEKWPDDWLSRDTARERRSAARMIERIIKVLGIAAGAGFCNAATIGILLKARENDNISKTHIVAALGHVASAGFATGEVVSVLKELHNRTRSKTTVWALGQAYKDPKWREEIEPLLLKALASGDHYIGAEAAEAIAEYGSATPEVLAALKEAAVGVPAAAKAIGRLAERNPLSLNYWQEVMAEIKGWGWEEFIEGLGFAIRNQECPRETLELLISNIIRALRSDSDKPLKAADVLSKAGILQSETCRELVTVVRCAKMDQGWHAAAQAVADAINAARASPSLLLGLHWIVRSGDERYYFHMRGCIARMLGYVDSPDSPQVLLDTFREKTPSVSSLHVQQEAARALAQIGRRHPELIRDRFDARGSIETVAAAI